MGILEKDSNKVKVKIETDGYKENFNSELTQEDEVNIEEDNVLNDYNLVESLTAEVEESK